MSTVANVKSAEGSHYYYPDGKPCYELPKADGKGMKVPTLADARKLNLLPGVSNILKLLHKEALVVWRIENAILAIVTTPRLKGEKDDEFIKRVLSTERVQDQESNIAKDRGTAIHDGLDLLIKGHKPTEDILPWIKPACDAIRAYGNVVVTEYSVAGNGYGGRIDLVLRGTDCYWVWDWKTTKKLPKESYDHAKLQLAAYAKIIQDKYKKPVRVGNVYISTVNPGEFVISKDHDWQSDFKDGFEPLLKVWQHLNKYFPVMPKSP